jgi:hypothetical protein
MDEKPKSARDRLSNIREFFWPILEPFSEEQIKKEKKRIEKYSRDSIQTAIEGLHDEKPIELMLDQAEKLFTDEGNRLENVERKCAIITGFSGIAVMLSFGFIKILFEKSNIGLLDMVTFFTTFLIVNIYLLRALLYSVEGLKRKGYFHTTEKDILDLVGSNHPKRHLISVYLENRVKNFSAINSKVDSMQMAILFFKRALIAVFIIALVYFLIKIAITLFAYLSNDFVRLIHCKSTQPL